jgi:hypothetical protein
MKGILVTPPKSWGLAWMKAVVKSKVKYIKTSQRNVSLRKQDELFLEKSNQHNDKTGSSSKDSSSAGETIHRALATG